MKIAERKKILTNIRGVILVVGCELWNRRQKMRKNKIFGKVDEMDGHSYLISPLENVHIHLI